MSGHRVPIDRAPTRWSGRDDGPGAEHARWHHVVKPLPNYFSPPVDGRAELVREGFGGPAVVGFASDEGVRRNAGRVGAAEGPTAIRAVLGGLADPGTVVVDLGDVVVDDGDLEAGQARLATVVTDVLHAGALPVVLGGGHAVAYGSGSGWVSRRDETWGVLNLDAHLDLRKAEHATSGTPFLQLADDLAAQQRRLHYSVIGLSRPSNTRTLLDTADRLGVAILDDVDTDASSAVAAAQALLAKVDRVHLTLDLDVLPASVAPGVSAPAAFGVPVAVVLAVLRTVAASGKLGLFEVAELNPRFDIDARTARTAARCVDEVVRHLA